MSGLYILSPELCVWYLWNGFLKMGVMYFFFQIDLDFCELYGEDKSLNIKSNWDTFCDKILLIFSSPGQNFNKSVLELIKKIKDPELEKGIILHLLRMLFQ